MNKGDIMLRILPVSYHNVSFGVKAKNDEPKFIDVQENKRNFERELNYSFLAGAMCAATILYGINQCENSDRDFMMEEIATQLKYSDKNNTKIKVVDATKDGNPDFIIEDEFGVQSIYDIKNTSLYYKDGEEIEKIY